LEHQELPGVQNKGAEEWRLQPHDLPGEPTINDNIHGIIKHSNHQHKDMKMATMA
jgi:hypothetical protein